MQKGAIFGSAFGANQQISLSRLKSGEDVRLFVKSGELLTLFEELSVLYALHAQHGTQPGKSTFTKADPQLTQLAKLSTVDLNAILEANSALGGDLLTKLLTWATAEEDLPKLVHRLLELSPNSLRILITSANLLRLKSVRLQLYGRHICRRERRAKRAVIARVGAPIFVIVR